MGNNLLKRSPTKSILKVFVFGMVYEIVGVMTIGLLFVICDYFNDVLQNKLIIIKNILAIALVITQFIIVPYRSYLLKNEYFNDSCKDIFDAHKKSTRTLFLNLSFLPIIGFLFKAKEIASEEDSE